MKYAGIFFGHLLIVGVTVLAGLRFALPWALAPETAFAFPMLVLAVMAVAVMRHPMCAPSWLCFACGLSIDIMTQGVLGYWALVYLAGTLLIRLAPQRMTERLSGRLVALVGLGLGVLVVQTAISWIIYQQAPVWDVVGFGVAVMIGAGIVLEVLLALIGSVRFRSAGFGLLGGRS